MANPTNNTSTKDFVEITDLRETVAILKGGSLRSIIEVNAVNFDLKSQDEQNALIQGFQNFINYVDFPLQIVISSRKLDIKPYLASLETLGNTVTNELLKIQLYEYSRFIKGLTDLANIVAKKFYVVVPFYAVEAASVTKGGFLGAIKSIVSPRRFTQSLNEQEFQNYKSQLDQRISVIMGSLSSMGLQPRILENEELKNLYYTYYNPGQHLT